MEREHGYEVTVGWTGGDTGPGTRGYREYSRDTRAVGAAKATSILGSADPTFLGDAERWNPEELLVVALSQCHMLSYLAACALKGVVVTGYEDTARGTMTERGGAGRFTEVTLNPVVTVADAGMVEQATALHDKAHRMCFIANSVDFPVRHAATVRAATDQGA